MESGKSSVAGRTLNASISRLWCEPDPLCLRLISKPVGGLDEGIERVQSGPQIGSIHLKDGRGHVGDRVQRTTGAEQSDQTYIVGAGGDLNVVGALHGGLIGQIEQGHGCTQGSVLDLDRNGHRGLRPDGTTLVSDDG